ncbi:hypothetical protein D3C86_2069880 [compost metagenome]
MSATDSVALKGPPLVSDRFRSNSLKDQEMERNKQTVTAGITSGRVTWRKACMRPAPSTLEASIRPCGTLLIAEI